MFTRNLVFALRLYFRQKTYSIISLTSFSLGLTCFLLMLLYYQFQVSYDQFHEHKDRIFRLNREQPGEQGTLRQSTTAAHVASLLEFNVPEMEKVVRLAFRQIIIRKEALKFRESIYAADPGFFQMFSFELATGNPATALSLPGNVVLTAKTAKKYFSSNDPLNQNLTFIDAEGKPFQLKITGVLKDIPANSHLKFDALVSFSTYENYPFKKDYEEWAAHNWSGCNTYLLLKEGADALNAQQQINQLTAGSIPDNGMGKTTLSLQPITDIFFNPTLDGMSGQRGNRTLTNLLLLISLFILGIAMLNYVNLSTARSLKRAHEVGMRKVMGAEKRQLMIQFVAESVLMALASMLLALLLIHFLIPQLNRFSNILYTIELNPDFLENKQFLLSAILATLGAGIIAGIYPAFILSRFKTLGSLKGNLHAGGKNHWRRGLVVFQYGISVVLIILSLAVYKITRTMEVRDFGFVKDNLLAIHLNQSPKDPRTVEFRERLTKIPGIAGSTGSSRIPLSLGNDGSVLLKDPATGREIPVRMDRVDAEYFQLLQMNFIQKPEIDLSLVQNDRELAIVNQAFMEKFGDQYSLGDRLEIVNKSSQTEKNISSHPEIAGVVENSLDKYILLDKNVPVIYYLSQTGFNFLLIKLAGNQPELIGQLEALHNQLFPEELFEYVLVDQVIQEVSAIFTPFTKIIFFGTFFAIFIASLGLFALSLFETQQRLKEIGIRKVHGATSSNITCLLAFQFLKYVMLAFILAGPVTFLLFRIMMSYLRENITLEWPLLFITGLFILGLATITVWIQSYLASITNPVQTLRYE